MKQLPYFKLTQAEPETALWVGLIFMLMTVTTILFVGQRVSNFPITTRQAQANATQQQNLLRALQRTFAVEGQQGEVSIKNMRTHIQLIINGQLLFPSHETELSPTGKNSLNRLTQALKTLPDAAYQQIQIEGHTDHDGYTATRYPRDNWELSSGEAVSALRYLASTTKLDNKIFSAHGYADSRPLITSGTGAGNRRLEVKIFLATYKS